MGCLFALFAGVFPRLALFIIWIARPALVAAAFNSFIWPFLGIIFLPFATLIYVILAALFDIAHWGASYTQRNQLPGMQRR